MSQREPMGSVFSRRAREPLGPRERARGESRTLALSVWLNAQPEARDACHLSSLPHVKMDGIWRNLGAPQAAVGLLFAESLLSRDSAAKWHLASWLAGVMINAAPPSGHLSLKQLNRNSSHSVSHSVIVTAGFCVIGLALALALRCVIMFHLRYLSLWCSRNTYYPSAQTVSN